mmetsp:Transcript_1622/g.4828  ORF Transcript_1622/g.4828 Transcript_1622/m.4828 type:complete len:291 (+) Transcript_1622:228-1100(+)
MTRAQSLRGTTSDASSSTSKAICPTKGEHPWSDEETGVVLDAVVVDRHRTGRDVGVEVVRVHGEPGASSVVVVVVGVLVPRRGGVRSVAVFVEEGEGGDPAAQEPRSRARGNVGCDGVPEVEVVLGAGLGRDDEVVTDDRQKLMPLRHVAVDVEVEQPIDLAPQRDPVLDRPQERDVRNAARQHELVVEVRLQRRHRRRRRADVVRARRRREAGQKPVPQRGVLDVLRDLVEHASRHLREVRSVDRPEVFLDDELFLAFVLDEPGPQLLGVAVDVRRELHQDRDPHVVRP